jgi:hypothetical protein
VNHRWEYHLPIDTQGSMPFPLIRGGVARIFLRGFLPHSVPLEYPVLALAQVVTMLSPTEVRGVLQRVKALVKTAGLSGSDMRIILVDVGDSPGGRGNLFHYFHACGSTGYSLPRSSVPACHSG